MNVVFYKHLLENTTLSVFTGVLTLLSEKHSNLLDVSWGQICLAAAVGALTGITHGIASLVQPNGTASMIKNVVAAPKFTTGWNPVDPNPMN